MNVYKNPIKIEWEDILKRPTASYQDIEPIVSDVFKSVKANGDKAIAQFTEKFDGVSLSDYKVSTKEIEDAKQLVSPELQQAIIQAKDQITVVENVGNEEIVECDFQESGKDDDGM